jgi:hypothetical protein
MNLLLGGSLTENGNIAYKKLHTVTGNISRILVEQLQIHHFVLLFDRVNDLSHNENVFCIL